MRSINPFAMDFTGAATDTASYPTSPTPQQGSIIKSQNPYSFTGQDANGMFMGGGEMPEQQVRTQDLMGVQDPRQPGIPQGYTTQLKPKSAYAGPAADAMSYWDQEFLRPGSYGQQVDYANAPKGITLANGQYLPAFHVNDWEISRTYNPGRAGGTISVGDGDMYDPGEAAGWGDWKGGLANVGNYFPGWSELNPKNWEFFTDDTSRPGELTGLRVKDSQREAQNVGYTRQGDWYVPSGLAGRSGMDTNKANREANMVLGAIAAMVGATAMGVGSGASTAASSVPSTGGIASTGGMSTVPGAGTMAPSWMSGAGTGGMMSVPAGSPAALYGTGYGAAGLAGSQFANSVLANGVSQAAGAGLEGSISGAEEYFIQNPSAGPGASAGSGVGNGSAGGIAGGTVPSAGNILNAANGATNWLDVIKKGAGGLDKLFGGGGAGSISGGRGGVGGGIGGGILPLLAALYGKEAQGRYADDLKGIATNMRNDAEPFLGKLKDSYTNPNAYFESPDVKARLELEANRLTGLDSSRGRLSNPIERDMLLQKYAAKDINDYRSTLRNNVATMYNPQATADMFAQASAADRARYGDMMALAGLMSMGGGGGAAGGGFRGTVDGIGEIIDAGGDLWDIISDWWS